MGVEVAAAQTTPAKIATTEGARELPPQPPPVGRAVVSVVVERVAGAVAVAGAMDRLAVRA